MKSNFHFQLLIPTLLFLVFGTLNAQYSSPPWAWAKTFYGTHLLESPAIAVDPSGRGAVYTAGSYSGTVDFDPGIGIFNLNQLGLYGDIFISKLDGNGNFVWAKQINGSPGGSCYAYSIKVDPSGSGDVYTTGVFYGSVDFDPGPGTFILRNSGFPVCKADVFISKLDSSGNFKWAKSFGGTDEELGRSIAFDPFGKGNVYILGSFKGTIDVNPNADSFKLTSVGLFDFFITKLDSEGNFVWAKSIGGKYSDTGFAMAVDPKNGDVCVTGEFRRQVNFNPADSSHILNAGPYPAIFILKLDSEGNFVWAKPIGGPSNAGSAGYAIAIDPNGNGDIYTTGNFKGEIDFNSGNSRNFHLSSTGREDVFISKLDNSGNFVWAAAMGGISDDKGNAIAFDPADEGGVYIMGNFTKTADLDPGKNVFNLTAVHSNDMFIAKLYNTGDFEWAKPVFANQSYQSSVMALDGRSLFMAGLYINPTITFDSINVTNPSYSGNCWDVFIAKLNTSFSTSVPEIYTHPILVYPNPATDELTIEFEGDKIRNVGIKMFNVLGEVVYSDHYENFGQTKSIDISNLSTGIYFLDISLDGKRVMKKIVKE